MDSSSEEHFEEALKKVLIALEFGDLELQREQKAVVYATAAKTQDCLSILPYGPVVKCNE